MSEQLAIDIVARSVSTIVVATDFSETANLAATCATELARSHGARLVLAHGFSSAPIAAGGPQLMALPPNLMGEVRAAARDALEERAREIRAYGIDVEIVLEEGSGAGVVLEAAEKNEADLVVTGTRGLTGFSHLLMGSTAEEIVRRAPCPVIAVHPGDVASFDAVKTVVVATDFSEDAKLATSEVTRLLDHRADGTRLILVYAYHLPTPLIPLAGRFEIEPVVLADAVDLARRELEPVADELRARGFEVDTIVREGSPVEVITSVAKAHEADLIAMGTRGLSGIKHLLLGSTADRVVRHAACPVLTVRRRTAK